MAPAPPAADPKQQLRARFVGKTLHEVPTPSVVLDLAKLEKNCARMLDATARLGLLWRAHIKSHKTTELTRLQVGDTLSTPVSLIVSTLTEAENILPLVREYSDRDDRPVDILFSLPPVPSIASRLTSLSSTLSFHSATLTLMIDHPSQLASVPPPSYSSSPVRIFLKIDTSYSRAGVRPGTPACSALVKAALDAETRGECTLHGVYSHAGDSYGVREGEGARGFLGKEVGGLVEVAREIGAARGGMKGLVLSVGATPTALVAVSGKGLGGEVEGLVKTVEAEGGKVEVHAGVYPTLDMQQLAAHASDPSVMTADDIAISVVAEVASIYPSRGPSNTTEALINAGTLALGREPVADKGAVPGHDYAGWGFLMPWGALSANPAPGPGFPRVHNGWQVGRISQEHGILTWQGKPEDEVPLKYGERVRVWPNHSCIAGAGFDWYLIVDGRKKGKEDEVVDVWPRWRGW